MIKRFEKTYKNGNKCSPSQVKDFQALAKTCQNDTSQENPVEFGHSLPKGGGNHDF